MTVRCDGTIIHLEGSCAVEEAETLAGLLEGNRALSVDLSGCRHLHGALVQTGAGARRRFACLQQDARIRLCAVQPVQMDGAGLLVTPARRAAVERERRQLSMMCVQIERIAKRVAR